MESEKTFRIVLILCIVGLLIVVGVIAGANAYGSYLRRENEAQQIFLAQQRGGEPVCVGPDSVYVKYPRPEQTPASSG